MEEIEYPKKLKFTYSICAIVFGADESVLKIKLIDGFKFVKKSIYSPKDNLTTVFQTNASGLQRQYINAFIYGIDDKSGEVVCIEKEYEVELNVKNADDYWRKQNDLDLNSLDSQIRTIRLLFESPIRVKKISFQLSSEKYRLGEIITSNKYCSIFPVNESFNTKTISSFYCDDMDAEFINAQLQIIKFPLKNELLNSAHIFYDLSYHTESCVSITLLTTSLEIIYLKNEQGKKTKLSKRCAVNIGKTNEEITKLYKDLKYAYDKRCDFVHDGKVNEIKNEDILFLRDCVRKSLIKALESMETKSERIKRLKIAVQNNKHLFND